MKTAFGITSCIAFVLLFSRAPAQTVKRIDPSQSLQEELGIVIPMRDGVHLAADVFRPPGNGRWPALLVRTPYNRKA